MTLVHGPRISSPGHESETIRWTRSLFTRQFLLVCGILSAALYLAADMFAWSQYPGYSPISQAFSELLAEGAPTRPFMVAVAGAPYNLLVAALGVGVWASPGAARTSRIAGALLVVYAVISYLGGTVFHMDPRGNEGSARTRLHEVATAVMVVSMLLAMGVGAFLHEMRFRLYSLETLLTVVVFAGLSFLQAARLAANGPTPWLGLIERVGIYAWMLWVAVLALSFLRDPVERRENAIRAGKLTSTPRGGRDASLHD